MFINTDPEIYLHRGDSSTLIFEIYSDNNLLKTLYNLNEKDELYFGVMEPNQRWECALIRKKLTPTNPIQVEIIPNDTISVLPSLYYYQLKLRTEDGNVYTLCPRSKIYILE